MRSVTLNDVHSHPPVCTLSHTCSHALSLLVFQTPQMANAWETGADVMVKRYGLLRSEKECENKSETVTELEIDLIVPQRPPCKHRALADRKATALQNTEEREDKAQRKHTKDNDADLDVAKQGRGDDKTDSVAYPMSGFRVHLSSTSFLPSRTGGSEVSPDKLSKTSFTSHPPAGPPSPPSTVLYHPVLR